MNTDLQATLDHLRATPDFIENVVAWERLAPRLPRFAPFPVALTPHLIDLLEKRGIHQLYTHQAQAVDSVLSGQNTVVVTATASGKTLCYNLPTLQACLHDDQARALYLFPTKALAQDQAAALRELGAGVPIHIYDGDTPSNQRTQIRTAPGIVISNPDMLHAGILPGHTRWARFFENLRVVVIDELHAYRGIFGSHVANVIRRLRRICNFYGSNPVFICASATIANPRELAETLVEAPFTVVSDDGSPRGEKNIILYNPPLINEFGGLRRPYTLETRQIARQFLQDEIQTIVFARARLTAELLLTYIREAVPGATVRGYRGGYLPTERREIEKGLRDGSITGVVATNALELGVDIGQLSAAIIAGYPGTLASTWQQAGRAGRRAGVSAAVLIMSGAPLDQYIALHPRYLFESPVEQARINPNNLIILLNHVRCAAYELPFAQGEQFGAFGDVEALLNYLIEDEKVLIAASSGYRWISPEPPAQGVSLRAGGNHPILIQDSSSGAPYLIGQVDRATAPALVYPGAIYLHEGRQYQINNLDWEQGIADAAPTEVDFYTEPMSVTDMQVMAEIASDVVGDVVAAHGTVTVANRAVGYRIIKRYTHDNLGMGDIDLPEQRFETTAYWCSLTPDLTSALEHEGLLVKANDYGPNWQEQRNRARARDGFACTRCGIPEQPGREHHVHHIQPFYTFGYARGKNTNYIAANKLENLQTLCASCHRILETSQRSNAALLGVGNVLRNIATLYLMCEPGDLGLIVDAKNDYTQAPTILLYDNLPAGLGFSDRLYELHGELMNAARELIRDCPCAEGCPACVGPVIQLGDSAKSGALRVLAAMQA
jgi:DEAD/DEAH box helicase domain-containing protein